MAITAKDTVLGSISNVSVSSTERSTASGSKAMVIANAGKLKKFKKTHLDAADVLEKMWEAVRRNNGIMVRWLS